MNSMKYKSCSYLTHVFQDFTHRRIQALFPVDHFGDLLRASIGCTSPRDPNVARTIFISLPDEDVEQVWHQSLLYMHADAGRQGLPECKILFHFFHGKDFTEGF